MHFFSNAAKLAVFFPQISKEGTDSSSSSRHSGGCAPVPMPRKLLARPTALFRKRCKRMRSRTEGGSDAVRQTTGCFPNSEQTFESPPVQSAPLTVHPVEHAPAGRLDRRGPASCSPKSNGRLALDSARRTLAPSGRPGRYSQHIRFGNANVIENTREVSRCPLHRISGRVFRTVGHKPWPMMSTIKSLNASRHDGTNGSQLDPAPVNPCNSSSGLPLPVTVTFHFTPFTGMQQYVTKSRGTTT